MRGRSALWLGVAVATGALLAATVGLASLPPRPLRSALTVLHTLTFRVATDWLAVVALLAVGGRYASRDAAVDRRTVAALAAGVFLGGVAVETSPLVRLVVTPPVVGVGPFVEGVAVAVERALYPTGLFLGTVVGAATARERVDRSPLGRQSPLPLAPSEGWRPALPLAAVARATGALAAGSVAAFSVDVAVRVALDGTHLWLAVVDAGVGALGAGAGYLLLAVAFLALVVEGVTARSLAGLTPLLWAGLVVSGVGVAVLSAALGVVLVSTTTTPMAAVEAARLGWWPAPDSWATLLRVGTFLAGAVGLLAVQRTRVRREPPAEPGTAGRGTSGSGPATGTGSSAAGRGSNERREL